MLLGNATISFYAIYKYCKALVCSGYKNGQNISNPGLCIFASLRLCVKYLTAENKRKRGYAKKLL